jgi:hypothetical protein
VHLHAAIASFGVNVAAADATNNVADARINNRIDIWLSIVWVWDQGSERVPQVAGAIRATATCF